MIGRLETHNLTKAFESCVSVDRVNIKFEPGRVHAVLGENGAGKSTLLKTLFGLLQPTSGEIRLGNKPVVWHSPLEAIQHGIGMVQQHFTLVENQTVLENLILGGGLSSQWVAPAEIVKHVESLLPGPGFRLPWNERVGDLPVGQRQKVEILKLLLRKVQMLFLDEPTAVLTPQEVEEFLHMLKALRQQAHTIVIITHKIREARAVADDYTVLRQGRVVRAGQMADVSDEALVEAIVGRKRTRPQRVAQVTTKNIALKCEGLNSRDGKLKDINLTVSGGEVVGIAGVSGSGQVELVECILGLRPFQGHVMVLQQEVTASQPRAAFDSTAFIPQDRHRDGLWLEESVLQNATIGYESKLSRTELMEAGQKWIKEYDVRSPDINIAVEKLSGGNQQKLIFARELGGREPQFIVAHEPTRGVDIGAVDRLHELLLYRRARGAGILLLSSELEELFSLSDRICVLFQGRKVLELNAMEFDEMRLGAAMTGVEERK